MWETISTENQWEISEDGGLSSFIDFLLFNFTMFVIDIYIRLCSFHFFPTPFDHFSSHPTLRPDPALILTLRLKRRELGRTDSKHLKQVSTVLLSSQSTGITLAVGKV